MGFGLWVYGFEISGFRALASWVLGIQSSRVEFSTKPSKRELAHRLWSAKETGSEPGARRSRVAHQQSAACTAEERDVRGRDLQLPNATDLRRQDPKAHRALTLTVLPHSPAELMAADRVIGESGSKLAPILRP